MKNSSTLWEKVKIINIAAPKKYSLNCGPFGSNLVSRDYQTEGVPVIRGTNISSYSCFSFENLVFVSEEKADKLLPNNAHPGDLIFTQRGTLGQVGLLPKESKYERFIVSQSQMKLTVDETKVNSYFLYYYFRLQTTIEAIQNLAISSGVPHINLDILRNFEVPLPPLATQQRIADILSSYDRLIDNNNRRIALLEESIHQLYREWFVRSRFPGYESVKIIDGIPEGWNMGYLPNLCSKLMDGTHDSPKATEDGYYLVTGKHIINGFIDFSKCYFISPEEHQKVMKRSRPEKGDIIFSNIGTLGTIALVDQDFEFSIKNVALFKPLKKFYSSFLYVHLSDDNTLISMSQKASGTSQKFFSLKFLRNSDILIPPDDIIIQFDNFARLILEQRSLLNKNNQRLKEARDLLLPRLMNGSIAV